MKLAALLLAISVPTLASCAVHSPGPVAELQDPQDVANALLVADRAFAAQAADQPIAVALPAMFDDAVIMPLPTGSFATGKEAVMAALAANPANVAAKAQWAPVRAGVSADGTQGFTYGFMTIHEDGKPDRRANTSPTGSRAKMVGASLPTSARAADPVMSRQRFGQQPCQPK